MRSLTGDLRNLEYQMYGESSGRPKKITRLEVWGINSAPCEILGDQRYGESNSRTKKFKKVRYIGSQTLDLQFEYQRYGEPNSRPKTYKI